MSTMKTYYKETVAPALFKKFGYKSVMETPKLDKIVINVGCGEAKDDQKKIDAIMGDLSQITGQKPVICRAKKAIANFRWIDTVLGSGEKTVLECEQIPRREARRSLVLTRDMKAGEVIQKEDLMPKRPGTGISPVYTDIVIGRKVVRDLEEDTILTWDMV